MPLWVLRWSNRIGTLLAVVISASTLTPIFNCFALIETPHHDSRYDWLMYLLVHIPLSAPTSLPFQFFYILLWYITVIYFLTHKRHPPHPGLSSPLPLPLFQCQAPLHISITSPINSISSSFGFRSPPTVGQLITRSSPIPSSLWYWRAPSPPSACYFPQLPTPIHGIQTTGRIVTVYWHKWLSQGFSVAPSVYTNKQIQFNVTAVFLNSLLSFEWPHDKKDWSIRLSKYSGNITLKSGKV